MAPAFGMGYPAGVDPTLGKTLQKAIASGPPARFVALFGSVAKGTSRADSDVDLAWIPVDRDLPLADELQFQAQLTLAAGREVDLVRLDRASTLVRHEVAKDGQLLAGDPDAFVCFRAEAVGEYLDFEPALRDACEQFRRRLQAEGKP